MTALAADTFIRPCPRCAALGRLVEHHEAAIAVYGEALDRRLHRLLAAWKRGDDLADVLAAAVAWAELRNDAPEWLGRASALLSEGVE